MKVNTILQGDCIEQMKFLEENSIDAIITDPPYGLEFMGKEWDSFKSKGQGDGWQQAGKPSMKKFDGKNDWHSKPRPAFRGHTLEHWKNMQEYFRVWSIECLRVLKPGAFLLSFGGTRTYHRLTCGIEDAGFEIRDTIMWLYGSGFPKSLNIGKQIDKLNGKRQEEFIALGKYLKEKRGNIPQNQISKFFPSKTGGLTGCVSNWELGLNVPTKEQWIILKRELKLNDKFDYLIEREEAEREVVGKKESACFNSEEKDRHTIGASKTVEIDITKPSTQEAKQWDGWGTALKPACEPIVVARKPLSEKNVALNVLKWGTGGINIDACRIGRKEGDRFEYGRDKELAHANTTNSLGKFDKVTPYDSTQGRFPANIILDEEAGKMLNEQSGNSKSGDYKGEGSKQGGIWHESMGKPAGREYGDKGGASRFFYCAKASKGERNYGCEDLEDNTTNDGREVVSDRPHQRGATSRKNNHPTVKPIELMEYLIKLITREKAIVLDPFIGSGTTAIACLKLNRQFIGIEKEEEYIKIAEARIKPFLEQTKLK